MVSRATTIRTMSSAMPRSLRIAAGVATSRSLAAALSSSGSSVTVVVASSSAVRALPGSASAGRWRGGGRRWCRTILCTCRARRRARASISTAAGRRSTAPGRRLRAVPLVAPARPSLVVEAEGEADDTRCSSPAGRGRTLGRAVEDGKRLRGSGSAGRPRSSRAARRDAVRLGEHCGVLVLAAQEREEAAAGRRHRVEEVGDEDATRPHAVGAEAAAVHGDELDDRLAAAAAPGRRK